MRTIGDCVSRWQLRRRGVAESLRDVRDEIGEFLSAPSRDEFHDILWTLSRLGFDLFGWRWLPVTEYCWTKYEGRYQNWLAGHRSDCSCTVRSRCKCGAADDPGSDRRGDAQDE
jgi:hypothetical protein